jgi:hypothetical protein
MQDLEYIHSNLNFTMKKIIIEEPKKAIREGLNESQLKFLEEI